MKFSPNDRQLSREKEKKIYTSMQHLGVERDSIVQCYPGGGERSAAG